MGVRRSEPQQQRMSPQISVLCARKYPDEHNDRNVALLRLVKDLILNK